MKKILAIIPLILIMSLGYYTGEYLFREKENIIKEINENPEQYMNQEVQIWAKVISYSAREWVILEKEKSKIFLKHNMKDYYFKYGEKYIVKGEVKTGEIIGVNGSVIYINALEPPIRNNSWTWI